MHRLVFSLSLSPPLHVSLCSHSLHLSFSVMNTNPFPTLSLISSNVLDIGFYGRSSHQTALKSCFFENVYFHLTLEYQEIKKSTEYRQVAEANSSVIGLVESKWSNPTDLQGPTEKIGKLAFSLSKRNKINHIHIYKPKMRDWEN